MFATGKAIREKAIAEYLAKKKKQVFAENPETGKHLGVQQGALQERLRIAAVLIRHGVQLDKETADEIFGDSRRG